MIEYSKAAQLLSGQAKETIQQFFKFRQTITKLMDNLEQIVIQRISQYLDRVSIGEIIQNLSEPQLKVTQLAEFLINLLYRNSVDTIYTDIKYTKIDYSQICQELNDLLGQIKLLFSRTSEQMKKPSIFFDKECSSKCININYSNGIKVYKSVQNYSCLLIESSSNKGYKRKTYFNGNGNSVVKMKKSVHSIIINPKLFNQELTFKKVNYTSTILQTKAPIIQILKQGILVNLNLLYFQKMQMMKFKLFIEIQKQYIYILLLQKFIKEIIIKIFIFYRSINSILIKLNMPFVNAIFFQSEQFKTLLISLEKLKQSMIKYFEELEQRIKENIANSIKQSTFTQSLSYLVDSKIDIPRLIQVGKIYIQNLQFIQYHPSQLKKIINNKQEQNLKQKQQQEYLPFIKDQIDQMKEDIDFLRQSIKQQFQYFSKKYLKNIKFIIAREPKIKVKDLSIIKCGTKKDAQYIDFSVIMKEKDNSLLDANKITYQIIRGSQMLIGLAPIERLKEIRYKWKGLKQFGLYSINQNGVVISPYQEENNQQTKFIMNEQDIIALNYDIKTSKLEFHNYTTKEKVWLKIDKYEILDLQFVVGLQDLNDQINLISY